ncbi:MAG: hypothetical protein WAL34_04235 [Acidobacteriaceae bacterium]
MTEDEAKTKRCPVGAGLMARIAEIGFIPMNVYGSACIGSACMAWRWSRTPIIKGTPQEVWNQDEGHHVVHDLEREGDGYCGLAGKP